MKRYIRKTYRPDTSETVQYFRLKFVVVVKSVKVYSVGLAGAFGRRNYRCKLHADIHALQMT
jgi:hypothetical protein